MKFARRNALRKEEKRAIIGVAPWLAAEAA
jgi:hypothetical protein